MGSRLDASKEGGIKQAFGALAPFDAFTAAGNPAAALVNSLMGGPGAVPRLRSRLHEGAASLGECDASLWVVYAVKVGIDG